MLNLDEIEARNRVYREAPWLVPTMADYSLIIDEDVPALIAEVRRLREVQRIEDDAPSA